MKNYISIAFIAISVCVTAQTTTFDNLNANPLINKAIIWTSSNSGSGFGHRIINTDPGGMTLLNFQGRNNTAVWSDIMSMTSTGNIGIGTTTPLGKLHIIGQTYIDGGWLRLKANNGIKFEDYGGGFRMQDATWILTYGNKSFYHNTGILRTDGTLQVGPSGNRFVVNSSGNVGIGLTAPAQKLDVNGKVQSNGFVLVDPILGSNSDYTSLYREDIATDNSTVKLRVGDDALGSFQIGYKYWSTGEWIPTFFVNNNGRIGIGTTVPDSKLTVKGNIHAEEVKVDLLVPGPDYVFANDYDLPSLKELQKYILENKHLPNIPSAAEMEANGVELGIMNMKLLEKIEELTLYVIQLKKEVDKLKEGKE